MAPAAPTLMCIPSECRLRIFEFALADAFNEIVVYSPKGRSVFAWNAHQPLLSVSRQVRREALEYYDITLRITGEESLEDCGGDDYRNRLSPFIRRAISIVEIETVRGCNGQFINKDQFPNLKSILTYAEVDYTVQDGIELKEVIDGAHDPALLATIKSSADDFNIQNLPSRADRGFEVWVGVTILVTGPSSSKDEGDVTWSYDTNETLGRFVWTYD